MARRNALRRAARERSVPVDMTALAAISHPAPDAAETVADEDHVLSLLRMLPPRQRAADGRTAPEFQAKSRHLRPGSPGRYVQLGEQTSAKVTADAARRRSR